jgi:hypothetical protein
MPRAAHRGMAVRMSVVASSGDMAASLPGAVIG